MARAQHLQLIQRHHYLMAVATTIILMVASPLVIKALQTFHGGSGVGGATADCLPTGLVGAGAKSAGGGSGGGTAEPEGQGTLRWRRGLP